MKEIKRVVFEAKIGKQIWELSKKRFSLEFEEPIPIPSNITIAQIANYPKKARIIIEEIK